MTENEKDQLEDQLAQMTRWEGEPTKLWREALDRTDRNTEPSRWSLPQFFHRPMPKIAAAIIIVAALGAVLQFTYGPEHLGKSVFPRAFDSSISARGVAPLQRTPATTPPGPPDANMTAPPLDLNAALNQGVGGGGGFSGGGGTGTGGVSRRATGYVYYDGVRTDGILLKRDGFVSAAVNAVPGSGDSHQLSNPEPLDRQVIRKATIELLTNDVRATFLKATQLPSEARSEYLEASSLTGAGDEMQASLTLRVAADRLSEVLNQLRQLGEVRSEDSRGEDVTSQVVDLDARLRNERRIETELLELLDKRDDAPLREVLELRNHINRVRQSIEQLTAQQQRLGRLVSLATILVIIRAEDAPEPEPEPALGKYFSENIGTSWTSGLRFLSDTIANLLRVLVGGVIWWVLLTVAILAITRHHRQAHLPIT